ncbi:myoD family inhibitor domain-containing protein 2 [Cyclopterus lumpus]|uniref:myoD family inhibitor domain-containing protein 2 n=1 Tax=Cyclopterus lumpus TaxID=8103 RepID=UPI0014868A32|nr:myoD family inhibitor domain-containing protein 2 [Cyclopterus lumpus]
MCCATMDTKQDSADMNEKKGDGSDGNPKSNDSLATASVPGTDDPTADVTVFPERISTEDHEPSPTDTSVNGFPEETSSHRDPTGGATGAPIGCPVERDQPRCAAAEARRDRDASRSLTSTRRSPQSLKVTGVHAQPGGDDLCAAILLACLFCHPLDCLPAAARGCAECARWLCGFLCGCEPGTLRPLLEAAGRRRDLCGGPCACPGCLQASECLDLSMEISQMLYH